MPTVTDYTALLSGTYWSGLDWTSTPLPAGRPVFVTYSFPTTSPEDHAGEADLNRATFEAFTAADQAVARDALADWDDATGITFLEVAPGNGQIQFAWYDFSSIPWAEFSGGFAYYPFGEWNFFSQPNVFGDDGASGDVFVNTDYRLGGVADLGLLLHELGHALGLKHPDEVLGNGHDEVLDPSLNDTAHTIMSYNVVPGSPALGPLDVDAGQYIYGSDADDGTQVASWSWNGGTETLTQTGFATADTILGTSVRDVIDGVGGDDRLFGLAGNDTLGGGNGNDSLWGGDNNDTLDGGAGDDWLFGGLGNDSFLGRSEGDVVFGDAGNDTVNAGADGDYVEGGAGDDSLKAAGGSDVVLGGDGDDTIDGDGLDDNLAGGAGNDSITGDTGLDTLDGGDGDDVLNGVDDEDSIAGGDGNDTLGGGTDDDTLDGDAGNDTLRGDEGRDSLTGGADNDLLAGGVGQDTLDGGTGNDTLRGEGDRDSLIGGTGDDIFDFNAASDSSSLLGTGSDTIAGFDGIGAAPGDRVDVATIDAITGGANDTFAFIGTLGFSGAGQLRVTNSGTDTLILGNTDGDTSTIELRIVVADGAFTASDWSSNDFIL